MTERARRRGKAPRILIVEDEMLVAMLMEDMLTDLGHEVAGVAPSFEEAMKAAQNGTVDAAILDVHLNGETVFPVADVLARRRIPFAFATGFGERGLPAAYRDRPTLQKPFQAEDVGRLLAELLAVERA